MYWSINKGKNKMTVPTPESTTYFEFGTGTSLEDDPAQVHGWGDWFKVSHQEGLDFAEKAIKSCGGAPTVEQWQALAGLYPQFVDVAQRALAEAGCNVPPEAYIG